jgi:hypothetical protein
MRVPSPSPLFRPAGLTLLLALLATTGCDLVLTTAQLPPVRVDAVLGEWKDLGVPGTTPEASPLSIRLVDGAYRIGMADEFASGKATSFTLARVGNVLLAQSAHEGACDELGGDKGVPCWNLNRVELSHGRLNWYDFDTRPLGRASFSGALNVAHAIHRKYKSDGNSDDTILFAASAPELQRFLERYVRQRGVFRLSGRLERVR